eukprot:3245229-Prymnesium_polylepis.1
MHITHGLAKIFKWIARDRAGYRAGSRWIALPRRHTDTRTGNRVTRRSDRHTSWPQPPSDCLCLPHS